MKFLWLPFLVGCLGAPRLAEEPAPRSGLVDSGGGNFGPKNAENLSWLTPFPQFVDAPSEKWPEDRKIVFAGQLQLQVPDPDAAEKEVRGIVEQAKGWVHKADGKVFTLRVPAASFQDVMERLSGIGKVIDRKMSGADVTEEFHDLNIRIENAEKVRRRLLELLDKAKDVAEALQVERELARLSEEIERMKGKLKLMSEQIAHSTIVVALHHTVPAACMPQAPSYPFPWIRRLGLEELMGFKESK